MVAQRLSKLADAPLWHQLSGAVIAQQLGVNPERGLAEREAIAACRSRPTSRLIPLDYPAVPPTSIGGIHYLGQPKQLTLSICTLTDPIYSTTVLNMDLVSWT